MSIVTQDEEAKPFDFINSILSTSVYLMDNEMNEYTYPRFFVNKGLSQHIDCLLFANEMNLRPHLDNKLQYDYLFYSIKKGIKRTFAKWPKRQHDESIPNVAKYYGVSYKVARDYIRALNKEQIEEIVKATT